MFCSRCGNENVENAKFCVKCGAELKAVTYALPMQAEQNPQTVSKQKNKAIIALIIVLAVAVAAITAAGTLLWLNRPINRIEKAIENDDIETAAKLYGRLSKPEELTNVQNRMLDIAEELEEAYLAGDKTYDEVTEVYDILDSKVLDDNKSFRKMLDKIEEVNISRQNYDEAEALFQSGDYEGAKEKYLLVIEDDFNYGQAQAAVEECNKNITGRIVGSWTMEYDASYVLMAMWNYYSDDIYLPFAIYYTFNANNVGNLKIQVEDYDAWNMSLTEYYYYYFMYNYDLTEEELDEFLEYMGYESMNEWVDEETRMYLEEFNNGENVFDFTFDGSRLTINYKSGETDTCNVSIDDNELTMDFETKNDTLEELEIGSVLVFTKADNAVL